LLNRSGLEARRAARLAPEVIDALISADVLRMFVPQSLGGLEAAVSDGLAALEELTRADAPSGWCAMAVSAFMGSASAYLPDPGAEALFNRDDYALIAGLLVANGKVRAERVPSGFVFSGRSQFASGSSMATHFVFAAHVFDGGLPVRTPGGDHAIVIGIIPCDAVTLLGNWEVDGLEPTESVDYEAESVFIEDSMTFPMERFGEPPLRGTALSMGVTAYGSAMHGAVALGIARRLLEEIAALAPRRGRPGGPKIANRDRFNHELVAAELKLAAARSLFYDEVEDAENVAAETGAHVPAAQSRRIMAVVSHIHDVGMECADLAYSWAGSAAFRDSSAISRYYRDMNVARNHVQADRGNLAAAGPDTRDRLVRALELLAAT
jgi:alkylation response protein AidB-like acyl-CoA dehydrogenase